MFYLDNLLLDPVRLRLLASKINVLTPLAYSRTFVFEPCQRIAEYNRWFHTNYTSIRSFCISVAQIVGGT